MRFCLAPQRWLKQHREEKERERLSNVAMETSDGVKASLTSDEHDKENLHTVAPGMCVCVCVCVCNIAVIVDSGRLKMELFGNLKVYSVSLVGNCHL